MLKKPVSTAAIHTHRLATPRRCQAGRHCKGPTAGHLPRGSAAQRRRFPACFRQLGSMRVPARLLRRRRPQLAEGGEGRRTASDRNRDNRGHVDRRGVVQHLLQFRVVVTCKTTVCRKQRASRALPLCVHFTTPNGTYKPALYGQTRPPASSDPGIILSK